MGSSAVYDMDSLYKDKDFKAFMMPPSPAASIAPPPMPTCPTSSPSYPTDWSGDEDNWSSFDNFAQDSVQQFAWFKRFSLPEPPTKFTTVTPPSSPLYDASLHPLSQHPQHNLPPPSTLKCHSLQLTRSPVCDADQLASVNVQQHNNTSCKLLSAPCPAIATPPPREFLQRAAEAHDAALCYFPIPHPTLPHPTPTHPPTSQDSGIQRESVVVVSEGTVGVGCGGVGGGGKDCDAVVDGGKRPLGGAEAGGRGMGGGGVGLQSGFDNGLDLDERKRRRNGH
eukprot:GHVQ01026609.1.p1 GENE.GHVQ01026609.1~~GHVQ01026609.1.p1  ORF type:complete len:281 (+),score=68.16 GHVQ01026609.1:498-1340(+)